MSEKKEVFIVPSTHWDREWYKPFQEFRYHLVELVDQLLEIMQENDYYFTFDGQTIILEDYLEIKPERKEELLSLIREGKIAIGPWYLLPDEWLIGQESFIRNLETSIDLAKKYDLPQMNVGYLPDQFGHTRAVPQILGDLTSIRTAVIWRGVGSEITEIPFHWKSHKNSQIKILANYLPYGYGNAATLGEKLEVLTEDIQLKIKELAEFTTVPLYLLMNGTDHQFPQTSLIELVPKITSPNMSVKITLLEDYITRLKEEIAARKLTPLEYCGEFRSSEKAPLLQDTYSARMWIKQLDNKIEDLLVHYVEPISALLHFTNIKPYPKGFIATAWKWLLKNQPHDSICGCSVDQTHDEMVPRYSWAESIAETILKETKSIIGSVLDQDDTLHCLAFNPTNNQTLPTMINFEAPAKITVKKLITDTKEEFPVQPLTSTEEVLFENTFKAGVVRTALKMLPGRKLVDVYINEVESVEDVEDSTILHVTFTCGKRMIGDLDVQQMKEDFKKILNEGKYKRFHVKATMGASQTYGAVLPLNPWRFTKLRLSTEIADGIPPKTFTVTKKQVETDYYKLRFNSDGSFNLYDKITDTEFKNLHLFEDLGDRGDEYTFGKVLPDKTKITKLKRTITNKGPIFTDIVQESVLTTFYELSTDRTKRTGKAKIPITTTFRVYSDLPRIDITTTLTNTAKDHRLRICFNLPFESETTITSTHFGFIERTGEPKHLENFAEMPSGIQAQKRFIRVDNNSGNTAFTLFNKGLPEVELVNKSKLALTLIRATGYLSRQDYPERPMHAGPFLETPGAQEMNKTYTFNYSILAHHKEIPMNEINNHAEAFALPVRSYTFPHSKISEKLTKPLVSLEESMIKISSLRIRNEKLLVLLYNLAEIPLQTTLIVADYFNQCAEVLIDGSVKNALPISKKKINLEFAPLELKLIRLE